MQCMKSLVLLFCVGTGQGNRVELFEDADAKFLGRCHPDIVAETCHLLDKSNSVSTVDVSELSAMLSATRPSTLAFLRAIGIDAGDQTFVTTSGRTYFSCEELCRAVEGSLAAEVLPPTSDVGCRYEHDGRMICDVDLSPSQLTSLDFADFTMVEASRAHTAVEVANQNLGLAVVGHAISRSTPPLVELPVGEATLKVANLFRIYPVIGDADTHAPSLVEMVRDHVGNAAKALRNGELQKTKIKAQGYVARAIQLAPLRTKIRQQWFGKQEGTKDQVLKVLNSISTVFLKMSLRKGPKCGQEFAYTLPTTEAKDSKGRYLVFLCKDFFSMGEAEQIATLTHEASHHETAYTEDEYLSVNGNKVIYAYGRDNCLMLATQNSQKAITNADNYCFYINALNER